MSLLEAIYDFCDLGAGAVGWVSLRSAFQNFVTTCKLNPKVSQAGVERRVYGFRVDWMMNDAGS